MKLGPSQYKLSFINNPLKFNLKAKRSNHESVVAKKALKSCSD